MKAIQDDIRTITASTAIDTYWPVSNLQDSRPSRKTKGTTNTQTMVIDIGVSDYYGGSSALYIGNTNARTGTLKVYNSAKTVLYETFSLSFIGVSFFSFLIQKHFTRRLEVWQDYTYRSEELNLELTLITDVVSEVTITNGGTDYTAGTLSASGGGISGFYGTYTVDDSGTIDSISIIDKGTGVTTPGSVVITPSDPGGAGSSAVLTAESTIDLGICRAGFAKEFRNPYYSFSKGFKDYSISKKYHNGAEYYRLRGITRTFEGSILIDLAEVESYNNVLRQGRVNPIPWNLINNEEDTIFFGKTSTLPTGKRTSLHQVESNLLLEETL